MEMFMSMLAHFMIMQHGHGVTIDVEMGQIRSKRQGGAVREVK
jgi:hypothetical protein